MFPPANLAGLQPLTFLGTLSPRIIQEATSITVGPGTEATLSVRATSIAPLSYQWRKDGIVLPGQTSATLVLNRVEASDAGSYTVQISNAAGSVTSSPAVLTLLTLDLHPGLTIVGPVGARYRIDCAPEADAASWVSLTEVILATSSYTFSDTSEPTRRKRFYRAVLLP